ncbi:MAG: DUF1549 and DUF1553 domain-containing protein [Planctomycetes bacterium]|nr:DUF1549 and DUF1553 domain-containing protein [Planctomycetota bacterium]
MGLATVLAVGSAWLAAAPSPSTAQLGLRVPRTTVDVAASRVDDLVRAHLERLGAKPNPRATDEVFVRRAYLQLAGRIPTAEEAKSFLEGRSPSKRDQLVDQLLESPSWDEAMVSMWADLFRVKSRLANRLSGDSFNLWLRQQLYFNIPYDEMVRSMLTAEGPAQQRGNGATGLLMRDREMPEDSMANSMRVFLGARLECAQCHDHPFKSWTQREFFEMVAFTGGIKYRLDAQEIEGGSRVDRIARLIIDKQGRPAARAIRQALQSVTYGIGGTGQGQARLPEDYGYEDAAPRDWVAASTVFGAPLSFELQSPPESTAGNRAGRTLTERQRKRQEQLQERRARRFTPEEADSRAAFSDWVTSPTNDLFVRNLANRMWRRFFGIGLIEPFDDLEPQSVASDPALMEELERILVNVDFDLKEFVRVLCSTASWQRAPVIEHPDLSKPHGFPGPLFIRMSAEQAWDSLLTLVIPELDRDEPPTNMRAERAFSEFEQLALGGDAEIEERLELAVLRQTDRNAFDAKRSELRREQRSERNQRNRRISELRRELSVAEKKGDKREMERLQTLLVELDAPSPEETLRQRRFQGLERAADLESPAPDGHFLRQFGQSDREQIDGSHQESSVPQALNLLNGFVETTVLGNSYSVLNQETSHLRSAEDLMDYVYLAILSREPTRKEKNLWKSDFKDSFEQAKQDLIWTLINSREFLFIQ